MDFWNPRKSAELYQIDSWGAGFFGINDQGNVSVSARGDGQGPKIDLKELVDDLCERGSRTPLLIRFPEIVESRIRCINDAFHAAMTEFNYSGQYRGVFPIKVNQQRFLVEDIVRYGKKFALGLEAGSKPELLVALALIDDPEALIVCNGFKDTEYIETALLSQKLGRNILIVVDRASEISMIVEAAKNLGIRPRIGFRAKLEARGSGKWVESSGVRSKFGLSASEMIDGIEYLKKEGYIESLELLHFHIGSQITALRCIKDSLIEAARIYTELYALGAGLRYIDVGGGLGVDYDGSQTNWENSVNYSVQEYANDVVWQIQSACEAKKVPHPTIITESGRATVAHHAVLVFDVLGVSRHSSESEVSPADCEEHETLTQLYAVYEELNPKNINESIQDALKLRDDSFSLFNLGFLNLKQRGLVEKLFQSICKKSMTLAAGGKREIEELHKIRRFLRDAYFCNFSIFQSAPDFWAVDQLFPIVPIHRLDQEPTRRGVLLDLTCDSDGKIEKFIDIKDVKDSLELHELKDGEDYYIGIFLLGAYQEILGDLHNLFGDTDAVHVSATDTGYSVDHVVEGDSISEVLGYLEYDRPALIRKMRESVEEALAKKTLSMAESRLFMRHYEDSLSGYTYLEPNNEDMEVRPIESLKRITKRARSGVSTTNDA